MTNRYLCPLADVVGVATREICGKESFQSVRRDGVLDHVGSNGLDTELVGTGLLPWCGVLDSSRLGSLFDFVHVP